MLTTVFFDLETGGLTDQSPNIQLAAIAVGPNWQELATFERKIQFDEAEADAEALKLNHYDPEVWRAEAKPLHVVVAEFTRFLEEFRSLEMVSKRTGQPYRVARLAGFNAATFDGPRLRRMFGNKFLPAHPIPLCVMQRALWSFHERADKPENYKLGTLCEYFGIPLPDAHDALADVRGTIALAQRLMHVEVAA